MLHWLQRRVQRRLEEAVVTQTTSIVSWAIVLILNCNKFTLKLWNEHCTASIWVTLMIDWIRRSVQLRLYLLLELRSRFIYDCCWWLLVLVHSLREDEATYTNLKRQACTDNHVHHLSLNASLNSCHTSTIKCHCNWWEELHKSSRPETARNAKF